MSFLVDWGCRLPIPYCLPRPDSSMTSRPWKSRTVTSDCSLRWICLTDTRCACAIPLDFVHDHRILAVSVMLPVRPRIQPHATAMLMSHPVCRHRPTSPSATSYKIEPRTATLSSYRTVRRTSAEHANWRYAEPRDSWLSMPNARQHVWPPRAYP